MLSWVLYACLPSSVSPLSILWKTTRLFACFSAGMTLFMFRESVPMAGRWALLAAIVLSIAFFRGGLCAAMPWAGAYLLIYLACLRGLRLENFCRHGDFSYGLYIFACPIQQLLLHYIGPDIPVRWLFALAYLPALTLAVLSWHLVEAPALALKPRPSRPPSS